MNINSPSTFFSGTAVVWLVLVAGCSKPIDLGNASKPAGDPKGQTTTQVTAAPAAKNCTEHGLPEEQ